MTALRRLLPAAFAALLALPALPTAGWSAPATGSDARPAKPTPPRAASLDELFERLGKTTDESEAKGITASIERRWMRSGSDTADLLMDRAMQAVRSEDQALAVELLDRVIALRPDWAEAWNKRATVFFMMGDTTRSMADIREVLAREPRHYGALAGMGMIMKGSGDDKRAFEAFKKALALNPFLGEVKKAVEKMAPDMDGKDI